MSLPFAAAAEQNKQVIFEVLESVLHGEVLEIGSGTGQHAVFFAGQKPELRWQTSDLAGCLAAIAARIDASGLDNLPAPIELDVLGPWPESRFDLVYSANCLHIVDLVAARKLIEGAAGCLRPGGLLAIYGPVNYQGRYTSASNARFDRYLKAQNPASGLRDFEWLDEIAQAAGLELQQDHAMPANNRCLIWQKRTL